MADDDGSRIMHMVTVPHHAADGLAVDYGPGELHEPGTLPAGVGYTEVVATAVTRATAPAHARPAAPPAAPEPEAKAAPAPAAKVSGKA